MKGERRGEVRVAVGVNYVVFRRKEETKPQKKLQTGPGMR
jgi:hypothetical protein